MGTISPDELARLWRQEQLSVEMAIGHITQNLVNLHTSLETQQRLLIALRTDLERITTPPASAPAPHSKKQRPK